MTLEWVKLKEEYLSWHYRLRFPSLDNCIVALLNTSKEAHNRPFFGLLREKKPFVKKTKKKSLNLFLERQQKIAAYFYFKIDVLVECICVNNIGFSESIEL